MTSITRSLIFHSLHPRRLLIFSTTILPQAKITADAVRVSIAFFIVGIFSLTEGRINSTERWMTLVPAAHPGAR